MSVSASRGELGTFRVRHIAIKGYLPVQSKHQWSNGYDPVFPFKAQYVVWPGKGFDSPLMHLNVQVFAFFFLLATFTICAQ